MQVKTPMEHLVFDRDFSHFVRQPISVGTLQINLNEFQKNIPEYIYLNLITQTIEYQHP